MDCSGSDQSNGWKREVEKYQQLRWKEQMEKENLEIIRDRIMEIQRTVLYDLMLTKTKELCWKENCKIQNTSIEDCQENIVIGHRQY
jgi:hypothetical protein